MAFLEVDGTSRYRKEIYSLYSSQFSLNKLSLTSIFLYSQNSQSLAHNLNEIVISNYREISMTY